MPSLERRKIYAIGGSLVITLPPGWLAYFGLKAGDEVRVLADRELVISPNTQQDICALEGANTKGGEV